jgi:predicted dithiol-disulfide oxidoreductase (DUF899 family)
MTDTGAGQPLHDVRFPGESDRYRTARNDLLAAKIELRQLTEAVAAQRRRLPLGGEVTTDYVFDTWDPDAGAAQAVRLSDLFADGKETLLLYSMMFLPTEAGPIRVACPSCTSIIDAVAGEARDISQRVNLAVAAKGTIQQSGTTHERAAGAIFARSPPRARPTAGTTRPRRLTEGRTHGDGLRPPRREDPSLLEQ